MSPNHFLSILLQRLRSWRKGWSAESDRQYHEAAFAQQDFDPFSFNYPGYITIRRFADLAAPHLAPCRLVADMGCGCGEITCELARRFPAIKFLAFDHSQSGISRAETHARRLGLGNITFRVADVERLTFSAPLEMVLMFDAFHHLTDPAGFVRRLAKFSPRFLLIEPRGDWKGSWCTDLDFDWLGANLDIIRRRIALQIAVPEEMVGTATASLQRRGEPVEHRYNQADFLRFFSGFGVEFRGTVSGIAVYPPNPLGQGLGREYFGRVACDLYAELDRLLHEKDIDLLAKHWLIYAEKDKTVPLRKVPTAKAPAVANLDLPGPWNVIYSGCQVPRSVHAGESFVARVSIKNKGYRTWSSQSRSQPDFLAYHWLDHRGQTIEFEGQRGTLPKDVVAGEECEVEMHIFAPEKKGRYVLAIDLVQEGVTWFSAAGSPCQRKKMVVR